jgi:hypothetical protein
MNRRVLVLQLLHDIRDFLAAAVLAQWILRRYTHAVSSSPGCSTSTSSQRNHSSGPGAKDPEGSAFAADCDAMLAAKAALPASLSIAWVARECADFLVPQDHVMA